MRIGQLAEQAAVSRYCRLIEHQQPLPSAATERPEQPRPLS